MVVEDHNLVEFAIQPVGLATSARRQTGVMQRAIRHTLEPARGMCDWLARDDQPITRKTDVNALRAVPAFEHRAELHLHPFLVDVVNNVTQLIIGRSHLEIAELPPPGIGLLKHRADETDPLDVQLLHFINLESCLGGTEVTVAGIESEAHTAMHRNRLGKRLKRHAAIFLASERGDNAIYC